MTNMIPCRNTSLCGVQSHRPGTQALCLNTKGAGRAGAAASHLSQTPKLGASGTGSPVWSANDYDPADNDLAGGAPDTSAEVRTDTLKDWGIDASSTDWSNDRWYESLGKEGQETVDMLRQGLRDRHGIDLVNDEDGGSLWFTRRSDGASVVGDVEPTGMVVRYDDNAIDYRGIDDSPGRIDRHIDHVASTFNEAWETHYKREDT